MPKRGGVHFSFKFIRETVLRDHDVDIQPLWNWLVKEKGLPGSAKVTSDVVSTVWGIYAKTRPLTSKQQASPKRRRRRGVWLALWQCYRATVSQLPQAQFLVDFGKALSRAQAQLNRVSGDLAAAQRSYVAGLKEHLVRLRQLAPRRWKKMLKNINLPGKTTLGKMAQRFRETNRCLADLHANITNRLASSVPVAPRVRRGPRGRYLLKQLVRVLDEAGFVKDEIKELLPDKGSKDFAKQRVSDRLRGPRRRRRKRQAQADHFGSD